MNILIFSLTILIFSNTPLFMEDSKTRDLILHAAKKLFAKKGFDGSSVKEICDLANANISAVNYHFKSKEALLQEITSTVIEKGLSQLSAIIENEAESKEEFKFKIKLIYEKFFSLAEEDWDALVVIFTNMLYFKETYFIDKNKFFENFLNKLKDFIELAKNKSFVKKEIDSYIFAKTIFHIAQGIFNGYYVDKKTSGDIFNKEYKKQHIQNILDILLSGALEN